MANLRPRGSSIFSGLILIFVGTLLLLHNYRGYDLGDAFKHWWPLILVVWGAVKLYERAAANRSGDPSAARITAGEIFLVVGLLCLMGVVVGVDTIKGVIDKKHIDWGNSFDFDLDGVTKKVPPDARIVIRGMQGDISVRASDDDELRAAGKKKARAWNESDAERIAKAIGIEITQNGDGYEVHPTGIRGGESRLGVDLDVSVPKKAQITVRNEKGDVSVSDLTSPVSINETNGDVEVRDTTGDVSVDTRKGDVKISDIKGNVKIAGRGGEVNVTSATGGLTLEGEFYGPIRADKIAKGMRFISQRTDLTLTQLTGHLEAGSGNLEIVDAPGNLILRTSSYDVNVENAGGKVKVDNRNGNIEVRFSSPPKEDIEITNSNAPISLSLPASSSFEIVADCHSGDIDSEFEADGLNKTSTHKGDSRLEGKYGSGRGPRITLKTSYGSISLHKTSFEAPPAPPREPKPPKPPKDHDSDNEN
jgi:Putative adhesin/Domain of unknown function (DUF5668)